MHQTEREPVVYLNRELTWLSFNQRVLSMAGDPVIPLLERVKFIAIVSANLDEFFMKRIGGFKQLIGAGVSELSVDGRTPQQQISESLDVVRLIEEEKDHLWVELKKELKQHDIHICSYEDLSDEEKHISREYFLDNIYPLLTPQAVDPAHPFPFISNLSLNLLVTLNYGDDDDLKFNRVKVPVGNGVSRFIQIGEQYRFVRVEELIYSNFDVLFPKMNILSCEAFHVVRNANTERDEESANDLMQMIEEELRDRHFAPIVRMSIDSKISKMRLGMLSAELGLNKQEDVVQRDRMHAMAHLFEIASLPIEELHDAHYIPYEHPDLYQETNLFYLIRRKGHILLKHPYQSFRKSVENFLEQASVDPKVRGIKMTVYRTSQDTKVVDHLITAAQNGKQVAVVVELKARFDEAANIRWASRMERAGVHVTYGIVGLKTHSKTILVLRQDYNGLQRYSHIGTGNYHAGTATLYSDLGLFTNDPKIGSDLTELFNYLSTGYKPTRNYQKLLPAPKLLKKALKNKINREIEHQSAGHEGLIQIKANALEDVDVVNALYEASKAGVKINLIIRDTCRIQPGVKDLSENITVRSIVGRFLEHSRIYHFHNAGDDECFIGSADPMTRNLESRVEILTPVEPSHLKEELLHILEIELKNNTTAWQMQADGTYLKCKPENNDESYDSQAYFMKSAKAGYKSVSRLKYRKTIVHSTGN
ncbi:MAG: Polyphosphate kinase (EC [uncultured Thiotrichaceae bacterium]|uniref:Polyphosphate kinase n=1 Tax=uncultured Thiotrichaceae bacterium TaxID=298394 RepID=A0A6S6U6L0_9GAMM|nr:MAG: Polyphosphate kinase (EC [uncultured Thiotrichaceae bacterium]